jgi:DNA-directed RNA polymerase subunit RPC12/RpoP
VREVETGIKCGACSERFRDYDQLILHIQNSHNSQNSQHQSPAAANAKKNSRNNKTKKVGGPQNLVKGAASKPARKNARKPTRNSNNKMVGNPQNPGNSTVSKSPSKEGGLQKKYLCLVCDKTFYTRALLERHTLQKHKIEGTDPRNPGNGTVPKNVADIKCSICSKEFTSNIQLSVHYNATHKRK